MGIAKGFAEDPKRGWEWRDHWRQVMLTKEPNSGHKTITELESLLPNVTVLTQNIARLHGCIYH
jgi:NAD-dependent SIR2 family protein deacetylase